MRQQEKYAYLQEFLNISEQPRHHRPAIPLNGVSRVRIPPPPLRKSRVCSINVETKERLVLLPTRFTPPGTPTHAFCCTNLCMPTVVCSRTGTQGFGNASVARRESTRRGGSYAGCCTSAEV